MNVHSLDSFNCTIPLLQKADSISQLLHNKDLTADVANAFGVIYEMQGKYNECRNGIILKAIATGSEESYKDSIGLLHSIYKETTNWQKHTNGLKAITSTQ